MIWYLITENGSKTFRYKKTGKVNKKITRPLEPGYLCFCKKQRSGFKSCASLVGLTQQYCYSTNVFYDMVEGNL